MTTLHHLLLLVSTIFTSPALSAINLRASHQVLSSDSSDSSETTTTTTSTASTLPLGNTRGIIPTPPVPPTIPSHPPGTDPSYESTNIHLNSPTQTPSSEPIFQSSSSQSSSSQPSSFQSLRPCTTTLTSTTTNTTNTNNRPCPPPNYDGTFTSYPSTTTLLKPIDCHGCMYLHDVEGGV
ncbi:hypothetical protein NCU04853 [Neurospora crassa OR74A]|uniref:Uncharacterized protein n=1 Tax=Neurospora crassa (strain ATCC 24698 / 74-OR23-1A / CBS 708.71 / DSM 1257 / FGSC 987) TaxID=367110 RepID=Q7S391_NEUCR|nr:hypothetical protein NCU04853 [Neurospora crassa OR74A]EAA29874.1 hypothetical protein NCU04853 [Neurospora crassa OR74A]|eukprot:XP_959110.1 hypothetical protein NCU04853 [Neurospora crassa OR74A]